MKITIYELLGLIKDGKAPKKIKYNDEIWEYYKDLGNYIRAGKPNTLFTMYYIHKILNNELEIIEEVEDKEYEDIEEFKEYKLINTRDILELEMIINKINADYNYKINTLIRNQKYILERVNKNEQ